MRLDDVLVGFAQQAKILPSSWTIMHHAEVDDVKPHNNDQNKNNLSSEEESRLNRLGRLYEFILKRTQMKWIGWSKDEPNH